MKYDEYETYLICLQHQTQAMLIVREVWGYEADDDIPFNIRPAFSAAVEKMCISLFEAEAAALEIIDNELESDIFESLL